MSVDFDKLQYHILPHPKAPLFKDPKTARLSIVHALNEINSSNFNPNEEIRELLRQFAMVNLWFNIKFICGFTGPYDRVNDTLHMEMCNFRQSMDCMGRDARAAGFVFRGAYKSTIWTHGSIPFEIVRNPNIRIRITSSRIDKAEGFRDIARRTFDSNELFQYLFPEHAIKRSSGGFVSPARTKNFPEPTVKVGSTGGASAGDHHDLLLMDDLIDEQDLNVENMATIEMENKINWFKRCEKPLLIPGQGGRVLLWGTRYAVDDLYDIPWKDCKKLIGYQNVKIDIKPENKWVIYYRKVIEDGVSVFPEAFSVADIDKLMEEDPWTAQTQYFNDPHESGLVEFGQYKVKKCDLYFDDDGYPVEVRRYEEGQQPVIVPFDRLNVVMSLDPAFTYKGISAKTCRSALVVSARDSKGNGYLLDISAGYYSARTIFNEIFRLNAKYKSMISCVLVETGAQQKMLEDWLKEARKEKGEHIHIVGEGAKGDKFARIRSTLGTYLLDGKLYGCPNARVMFNEEKNSFPMAKYRVDILDSAQKGLAWLKIPVSDDEINENRYYEMVNSVPVTSNVTGY